MIFPILRRSATLSFLLTLGWGAAQLGPAYMGSTVPFVRSSFCTQKAVCTPSGTVKLASGEVRDFFTVKLRKPQRYGPPSYTIYLSRSGGKMTRAALIYPPAQDGVEDGTFFNDFTSFITGFDLRKASENMFACELKIRTPKTTFLVTVNHLSLAFSVETVVLINDMTKQGEQLFEGRPASTKIILGDDCS